MTTSIANQIIPLFNRYSFLGDRIVVFQQVSGHEEIEDMKQYGYIDLLNPSNDLARKVNLNVATISS